MHTTPRPCLYIHSTHTQQALIDSVLGDTPLSPIRSFAQVLLAHSAPRTRNSDASPTDGRAIENRVNDTLVTLEVTRTLFIIL